MEDRTESQSAGKKTNFSEHQKGQEFVRSPDSQRHEGTGQMFVHFLQNKYAKLNVKEQRTNFDKQTS